MSKFVRHEVENLSDWTVWVRPRRSGYKMACCDCNLVHDLQFRIRREWRGNVVEFRARRNARSTAAMRRYMVKL